MTLCPLTTREAVKAALDVISSTRANWQIDEAVASATDAVEGFLHRSFRPVLATRSFTWPPLATTTPAWRLWLDDNELISVTTLSVAGATVAPSGWVLDPPSGPPYSNVQASQLTIGSFDTTDTWQGAITITGLFGYRNDETLVTTLAEGLDATETAVDVATGHRIGVGDLLRVGEERMIVTDRTWTATGATLAANLVASQAEVAVTVSDGTLLAPGERIQVDSETMAVESVFGNVATVRRAQDGSVLAGHTSGATVSSDRSLTVQRGALGTTAGTHSSAANVWRHDPPPLIRRLARAEALVTLGVERAGYTGSTGDGGAKHQVAGNSVDAVRAQAYATYGRKARFR